MDVTQVKADGLLREYTLTLTADDIKTAVVDRLAEVGKTAKVAGFRPGKIPMPMLQQRYGASVLPEVLEKLCDQGIQKIITDHQLRAALKPKLDVKDPYEEGKNLVCNVTIEILPEVGTVDLTQFSIEQLTAPLNPAEVDKQMARIQLMMGAHGEPSDDPIKDGDLVTVGFEGKLDGVPFEGGQHDGLEITIGTGSMIPGFEDQMIGLKSGQQKQIKVTFPDDYHAENLKGREATFDLNIVSVRPVVLPAIDDDLAKKMGKDTLADLKTAVEKLQLDQIDEMAFLDGKRKVLDAFADHFTFDLPGGLVDLEFDSIWRQVENERKAATAKTGGSDGQPSDQDLEKEKAEYRQLAVRRVRLGLVLAAIGREEKVEVTTRELQTAISKHASRYPGHEKQVVDYYINNPNAVASIRAPLFEDKVIRVVLEKAKVTKKEVPYTELEARIKEITEGED